MNLNDPTRMSGGELESPLRETFASLRKLIQAEEDVLCVLALHPVDKADPDTRWLYLIETPFASFPRFVIGTTDARNEETELLHLTGAEWSAQAHWQTLVD